WRCNHQAFGRDVQPAITNSPTHLLTKTKNITDRKKEKTRIVVEQVTAPLHSKKRLYQPYAIMYDLQKTQYYVIMIFALQIHSFTRKGFAFFHYFLLSVS
ncbi:MAG: hypothetical protein H0X50_11320, partial [Nitrosopumilus sp.]|nr:hypothetical protein [Nitrosopumilus sp.]